MSGRRTGVDDDHLRADGGREPADLTDLDGVGPARADKLRDAGFESVADLRGASHADLADVLGSDLADRVLEQVGVDGSGGEPASPEDTASDDEPESADSGPSVPSGGGEEDETGSGPSVPSSGGGSSAEDSGPSVPTGSGGESTVEADAGETSGRTDAASDSGDQVDTTSTGTPTTGAETGITQTTTAQGTAGTTSDGGNDALIAGLVSFFIPGVGNIINGQTERGAIILVIWIVWLVLGWGIGVFVIGSIIGFLTLGIGFLLVALVVSVIEFLIHVLAALDAYRGTKVFDSVEGKVNQVRGN